ncbi:MAG: polyprenol phosphomannose-dependent alpha 1,6 mannosyltransferase MptB, partial [Streptosporangiaceae bacterium]
GHGFRELGRAGALLVAVSVALVIAVGVLGPSATQPPLGGGYGQPPYSLYVLPGAWLVTAALLAALVVGAVGLGLALWATARGWVPSPRRVTLWGTAATAVLVMLPPMGSPDFLGYAAYGRAVTLGLNPYATAPQDLAAMGDPIGRAAEDPWTGVASVYGPVATAEQALASFIGGASPRLTVFALSVMNALAFVIAGLLLLAMFRGDRPRQVRAALLWTANPLLLFELVSGAHVDAVMLVFGVAAVAALGRTGIGSGALFGMAAAVKIPFVVAGPGLLWGAVRRSRRTLIAVIVGVGLVTLIAYAVAGPQIIGQINRISGYVSLGSPWHFVAVPLDAAVGGDVSRGVIRTLSYACMIGAAVLFLRGLPLTRGVRPAAGRVMLAFGLAWLVTAPYTLPWYDAFAWAFLPFVPRSRFDALLLVRTTVLAVAYIPGRIHVPADVTWWMVDMLRGQAVPAAMTLLSVAFLLSAARPRLPLSSGAARLFKPGAAAR